MIPGWLAAGFHGPYTTHSKRHSGRLPYPREPMTISTIGANPAISLQFLTPTPDGSTAWVTQLQTDTEAWAWEWLNRLESQYPTRKWRWIRTLEDSAYPRV